MQSRPCFHLPSHTSTEIMLQQLKRTSNRIKLLVILGMNCASTAVEKTSGSHIVPSSYCVLSQILKWPAQVIYPTEMKWKIAVAQTCSPNIFTTQTSQDHNIDHTSTVFGIRTAPTLKEVVMWMPINNTKQ